MGQEQPLSISPAEMLSARQLVEATFIHINSSFVITSARDASYNCVSWAALDQDNWWWPSEDDYWPQGIEKKVTIECFIAAFATLGYEICNSVQLEESLEKIVIFTKEGTPTHVARQLPTGRWTSKLGHEFDIAHAELDDLTGKKFGKWSRVLCRPKVS
jgi:hypothetical protein